MDVELGESIPSTATPRGGFEGAEDQPPVAVQIFAAHFLSSPHRHPPKQSIEPLLHSSVHIWAEQSGLDPGLTQVEG